MTKAKTVKLSLTPTEVEAVKKVKFNDVPDVYEYEDTRGDGIGALFKLALPFIKNVMPKVLGTLGLAAASGAVSGAANKATSGRGLKRAGGTIEINKKDLTDLIKIGNMLEDNKVVKAGFKTKMNNQLEKQRGGFIGTLLAGLAGSLLPNLLGGKGLKRAGGKLKKKMG